MSAFARALFACTLLALGAAPIGAHAQRSEASEASVKAAFLYKFAGYIEWAPASFASADAPFVLAVSGADDVHAELAKILPGRSVAGHPVILEKLREGDSMRGAHLLFAGRMEPGRLQQMLRTAQQQGVLAVTENERGLEQGAAINFLLTEDRVGFEVSLDSAEKSGHHISSRMLTVARRVIPKAS
jgi:hypothetical protein